MELVALLSCRQIETHMNRCHVPGGARRDPKLPKSTKTIDKTTNRLNHPHTTQWVKTRQDRYSTYQCLQRSLCTISERPLIAILRNGTNAPGCAGDNSVELSRKLLFNGKSTHYGRHACVATNVGDESLADLRVEPLDCQNGLGAFTTLGASSARGRANLSKTRPEER